MFVTFYNTRLEDEVICWIFSWFKKDVLFFGSWGFSVSFVISSKKPLKIKGLDSSFCRLNDEVGSEKIPVSFRVLSAGLYHPCRECDKSQSKDPYSVSSIVKCNIRVVFRGAKSPSRPLTAVIFQCTLPETNSSHLKMNTIPKHDAVDGRNFANQLRSVVYRIIFGILYIPGGCLAFLCISSIKSTLYQDFTSLFFSKVPVFDGARKTMFGCSVFLCQIFPQWWHHGLCMHGPKEKVRKLVQKIWSVLILSWNSERKPARVLPFIWQDVPPLFVGPKTSQVQRCHVPRISIMNFVAPCGRHHKPIYRPRIYPENLPDQLNLNVYL